MNIDESILQSMGGVESNSLNKILESNNVENDENKQIQIMHHYSNYDNDKFEVLIQVQKQCFNILSPNIQSIGSTFDELKLFFTSI